MACQTTTLALEMRKQKLREFFIRMPLNERMLLILTGLRTKAARFAYKEIAEELDVELVWGDGGAQTKKMKEFDEAGTPYIHIPSNLFTIENDAQDLEDIL